MIDINACLPTPEMKADFERFKTLSTKEERDAFKKEIFDFLSWKDEEPTNIKELLENCEVIEDE